MDNEKGSDAAPNGSQDRRSAPLSYPLEIEFISVTEDDSRRPAKLLKAQVDEAFSFHQILQSSVLDYIFFVASAAVLLSISQLGPPLLLSDGTPNDETSTILGGSLLLGIVLGLTTVITRSLLFKHNFFTTLPSLVTVPFAVTIGGYLVLIPPENFNQAIQVLNTGGLFMVAIAVLAMRWKSSNPSAEVATET